YRNNELVSTQTGISFGNTGLSPNVEYSFYVTAYNAFGQSNPATTVGKAAPACTTTGSAGGATGGTTATSTQTTTGADAQTGQATGQTTGQTTGTTTTATTTTYPYPYPTPNTSNSAATTTASTSSSTTPVSLPHAPLNAKAFPGECASNKIYIYWQSQE